MAAMLPRQRATQIGAQAAMKAKHAETKAQELMREALAELRSVPMYGKRK